MSAVIFQDYADDRADILASSHSLNGLRLALVKLPAEHNPDHADVDLFFFNDLHLLAIFKEINPGDPPRADPVRAGQIFRVRGGTRIPAGSATGQVRVNRGRPDCRR